MLQASYQRGSDEMELNAMEDIIQRGKGPAKVTTKAYRQNFDQVFKTNKALN